MWPVVIRAGRLFPADAQLRAFRQFLFQIPAFLNIEIIPFCEVYNFSAVYLNAGIITYWVRRYPSKYELIFRAFCFQIIFNRVSVPDEYVGRSILCEPVPLEEYSVFFFALFEITLTRSFVKFSLMFWRIFFYDFRLRPLS